MNVMDYIQTEFNEDIYYDIYYDIKNKVQEGVTFQRRCNGNMTES